MIDGRLDIYLKNALAKGKRLMKTDCQNLTYSAKISYSNGEKENIDDDVISELRATISGRISGYEVKKIEITFKSEGKKIKSYVPYIAEEVEEKKQSGYSGFKGTDDILGQIEIRATEVAERRMTQMLTEQKYKQLELDNAELKQKNTLLQSERDKLSGELETAKATTAQIKLWGGMLGQLGATKLGAKLDNLAGLFGDEEQPIDNQLPETTPRAVNDPDLEEDETAMDSKRSSALKRINKFMISLTPVDLSSMYDLLIYIQPDTTLIRKCIDFIKPKKKGKNDA